MSQFESIGGEPQATRLGSLVDNAAARGLPITDPEVLSQYDAELTARYYQSHPDEAPPDFSHLNILRPTNQEL
jgi:hypothetical protein